MVTEHRAGDEFLELGRALLSALCKAPGFLEGRLGRSPDEPDVWLLTTTWQDAGSMRRGFGTFDAKVAAAPVMVSADLGVSVFEVVAQASAGEVVLRSVDRAAD